MFPVAALQNDDNGAFVYVLISEKGYSRTIYTVSCIRVEGVKREDDDSRFELTNGGVKSGDRIITGSTGMLSDGQRVILKRR